MATSAAASAASALRSTARQPSSTLARSRQFDAEGPDAERALAALRRLAGLLGLTGTYRLQVASAIPSHAGLGSGTQLALAVGAALLALEGIERTPSDIAALLDRGARSAIGMAAFETGGFIVDGGRGAADRQPPILMRSDFPDAWRILLVIDPRATGVHGEAEATAFTDLSPLPKDDAAHVCRLVLMQLAPGFARNRHSGVRCRSVADPIDHRRVLRCSARWRSLGQSRSRPHRAETESRRRVRHWTKFMGPDWVRIRTLEGNCGPPL